MFTELVAPEEKKFSCLALKECVLSSTHKVYAANSPPVFARSLNCSPMYTINPKAANKGANRILISTLHHHSIITFNDVVPRFG